MRYIRTSGRPRRRGRRRNGADHAARKAKNFGLTLRRLLAYLKRHTPMLLLISLLVLISAGANVFGTYLLKPVVNRYILPGDIGGLIRMLAFMGAIYLAGAAATFGYSQLMVKTAQRIIRELRQDLFGTVQKLPLSYFDSKTHGELMSRFTNDIDTIAESLNNSFTALVQNTVMIAGTLTVLLVLNWKLGLIVIATFGGMALFLRYSSQEKPRPLFRAAGLSRQLERLHRGIGGGPEGGQGFQP